MRNKTNEITSKEIATYSEFKPYYLTKALQKLKDLQLLSKRSVQDERIVIVYVTDEQRDKINKLIAELESTLKSAFIHKRLKL